jgi:preprotein translocase subunit SecG
MRRLLEVLVRILATLFIVGFVAVVVLSLKYRTEPTQPRPDLGKVVEWNGHGGTYYVTQEQRDAFDYISRGIFIVFFCIAGVVLLQSRYDK